MTKAKKKSVGARSRRGCPPAAQVVSRNAELLDAATKVFLEAGFAGTGTMMTAIAKRAGASMETLYARYPEQNLRGTLLKRQDTCVGPN